MKRIPSINFGHFGWSKTKCPKCGGRLRLHQNRSMRTCKSRGTAAGIYSCYYIYINKQDNSVSTINFNTQHFSVVIRAQSKKTEFRVRMGDLMPEQWHMTIKTFDKILSYREVLKWEKSWIMQ